MVDGVKQELVEGVSIADTFDKANGAAPKRHHTQYFEVMSLPGLY
jgi:arylsulfatase